MTKNTVQRLAIFFLGIPLYVFTVLYLSFGRNILLVLLVGFIQFQAISETAALFGAKGIKVNRGLLTGVSLAASVFTYLSPLLGSLLNWPLRPLETLLGLSSLGALVVAAPFAFSRKESFPSILPALGASLFSFFYCGVLGSFLVFIASCFPLGSEPVFAFSLMTLGNDSLAWFFGMTLGRKRNIVDVSPNKSVAGFIGGFLGSAAVGAACFFLFPRITGSLSALIATGMLVGASTIVGDLVESAMKRSAGVKDSSAVIPGRGGVLDSVDSLLFSAPVFVMLASIFRLFSV
jgi:phosphatidate cytidylyltransferase